MLLLLRLFNVALVLVLVSAARVFAVAQIRLTSFKRPARSSMLARKLASDATHYRGGGRSHFAVHELEPGTECE